jgi:hypothetical protein
MIRFQCFGDDFVEMGSKEMIQPHHKNDENGDCGGQQHRQD